MKSLKILSPLFVLAFAIILFSCEKKEMEVQDLDQNQVSTEVLTKLAGLELNTENVELGSMTLPGGEKKEVYIVEGDYAISPSVLEGMDLYGGVESEQYRTNNLVSSPRVINVIGYTGSGNALSSKMQTALQWAINNYNRLNIGLTFNLTFGTDYQSKDIVVYQVQGAAGGMAGFPENGNPYKWVQIFSGIDSYSTNVIEHVTTHEIGHCLGLRHTDWWSRQSCGSSSGESANPTGAIHIPGTPSNYDATSLMKACFSGSEDGEFNSNDKIALEYLY